MGLACFDVIHVVRSYPLEDTDQRSVDQYLSRGGNASNNCTVAAEIGEACEFFGTLAEGTPETAHMERDMGEKGVRYSRKEFDKTFFP